MIIFTTVSGKNCALSEEMFVRDPLSNNCTKGVSKQFTDRLDSKKYILISQRDLKMISTNSARAMETGTIILMAITVVFS